MDKKDQLNDYRAERKERLAKAAKKKSNKKHDSTDIIAGVIKAIAIIAVIGIICAVVYAFGIPQSVIPAVKVGDRSYTMSEYSYYYSSIFQNYANTAYSSVQQYSMNLTGFDYTKDPAEQTTTDDDGNSITFDQLFRNKVMEMLESYNYYLNIADEKGITLSEENQEAIDSDIAELATSAGNNNMSVSRYISVLFGSGLNEKKLRSLLADQYLVNQIMEDRATELKEGVTDEQINAAYEEDPAAYQSVDIRLLGIKVEDETEEETDTTTEAATEADTTEAAAEADTTEAATDASTDAATTENTEADTDEAESDSADDTTEPSAAEEEETKEPSKAELLAQEMCDKVTDEASFIELCKEYCSEDQRETFEDPSASMAKNLKKSTISSQVSEDVAEWLFSADRAVGDKRTALAGDYAYVMMITKPAYRDEDALASARHILVSFASVAEELAAEEAELTSDEEESAEPTEDDSTTEAPADETSTEAVTDQPETTTAAAPEESTAPADETTTEAADDKKDNATEDEADISARGEYSAEVVLKAHDKAVSILEEYNAGEQTEDAFAALAEKYSDDTASLEEGG